MIKHLLLEILRTEVERVIDEVGGIFAQFSGTDGLNYVQYFIFQSTLRLQLPRDFLPDATTVTDYYILVLFYILVIE